MNNNIFFYKKVDSTNDELIRKFNNNELDEWSIIYADTQSKGKGQGSNSWESNLGGLYFSLLLTPNKILPLTSLLSGITLSNVLKQKTGLDFKIKWPNDIIYQSKKIAGILIEAKLIGNSPEYLIVGCGINLEQTFFSKNDSLFQPESIYNLTNKKLPKLDIINCFLKSFRLNYLDYSNGNTSYLLSEVNDNLAFFDKEVLFQINSDKLITGKVLGVDESGGLKIFSDKLNVFYSGKIVKIL